ncbi:hypothetical protein [Cellulomonas iranensis]|uniref:hypothetical protein n=1 Tax=Cellulomonas iranensis TaxID=76862 RepID=UPI0013D4188F|nr:hypothetical protein [Cellulomonas iranensis]
MPTRNNRCVFTPCSELASRLRDLQSGIWSRPGLPAPGLYALLGELQAWIDDPRPYDKRYHRSPWQTVSQDVREALQGVGPLLRAHVQALDALTAVLEGDNLGADSERRAACRTSLRRVAAQAIDGAAAAAAFDDLYLAISDAETPDDTVEMLLSHLESVLLARGQTLRSMGTLLPDVLEDAAWATDIARALVTGTSPGAVRDPLQRAGLPESERLQLCRDLLRSRAVSSGHQVAWVCFDRAHCRVPDWIVTIGGVTFFDGPTLHEVVNSVAEGSALPSHLTDRLPAEVLAQDALFARDLEVTRINPGVKEWVWARVDLGTTPSPTPLGRARRIATSLVDLAIFYDGGTRWRPMTGGLLVIDGRLRSWSPPYSARDDSRFANEWTSETLGSLADDLTEHFPRVTDRLLDLLAAAKTVSANERDGAGGAVLLLDVQVIELLSSMSKSGNWAVHLTTNLAQSWARGVVLEELIDAHRRPADSFELRHIDEAAAVSDLYESVPGSRAPRVVLRYDLAHERLDALVAALPAHAPGARRLRALMVNLQSAETAGRWIDRLVRDYESGVARLARCRNAAAHGGPMHEGVLASVRGFANRQAATVTNLGIWATVSGESVAEAHERLRRRAERWRVALDAPSARLPDLLTEDPLD